MEYPYVALLWSPHHEPQIIEASRLLLTIRRYCPRLHPLIIRQGFAVFTRPPSEEAPAPPFLQTVVLNRQRGVIFGSLFRRGSDSRLNTREAAPDLEFADDSLATTRKQLTEDCWGVYVAFLSHPESGDWSVLRDCSGMIPCYYTSLHEITIVFSDVRDLRIHCPAAAGESWLVPFDINWRYIAGFLAASQLQIRETGFKNVFELLAGESLESTAGRRKVHICWNPVSVAETDPLRNLEDARREVRDTTRRCIEAWAGIHHSVMHSLSGGFDSSLVLALLMGAAKRPEVIAVNHFGFGPGEDERPYARMAAQAASIELLEIPHETRPLETACSEIPTIVKPTISQALAGLEARTEDRVAASRSVEDIWTGQGGDHLFMAIKTGMIVADCFRDNGIGPRLNAVFRDAATLTGKSYARLARDALALRHSASFFCVAGVGPTIGFLAADYPFEDLETYTDHPWTLPSSSLPPAKRLQVIYLAEVLNRHRPNYGIGRLQEFHPLLSQPLIEVSLRIPVYHLLTAGKTRGLARKAFQTDLPRAIRERQRKGQTTHHVLGLFRDNRPFMTARLLEGRLVQHGLANREALRAILEPHALIAGSNLFSLLACLAAELWLEDWLGSKLPRCIPAKSGIPAAWRHASHGPPGSFPSGEVP